MATDTHIERLKKGSEVWQAWKNGWDGEVDLSGADLYRADLAEFDLSGVDLSGADLREANLRGVDFREADLRGADLRGANVEDGKFTGAVLGQVDLRGAHIAGVVGLNPEGVYMENASLTSGEPLPDWVTWPEWFSREDALAGKVMLGVDINLSAEDIDPDDLYLLRTAIDQFMEALEFEETGELESARGSWFQRLMFWSKEKLEPDELEGVYQEGREALRKRVLDLPGAEATEKLANAASNLIAALEKQPSGVLRIGELIVVKVPRNGESTIIVETISAEIARKFAANPMLLRDPEQVFNYFQNPEMLAELPSSPKRLP